MQLDYLENDNTARKFHDDSHFNYQQMERDSESILLVDDDPDQLILFEYLLKKYGYTVISASSGMEALDALCSGCSVDLIITDAMMPQINGGSLIQAVRSSLTYHNIPIIVLTAGYTDAAHWIDQGRGADMFCLKRDANHELKQQISMLLHSPLRKT